MEPKGKFTMRISRTALDMLGVRLYDNVIGVVAELVANAYDADAEHVMIKIPLGQTLAGDTEIDENVDKELTISVEDDGIGISPGSVNDYLKVGVERKDITRFSRIKKRRIIGRKGIGIIAPFGICKRIEIFSVGGEATSKGYVISHLMIDHDEIDTQTDATYYPHVCHDNGECSKRRGTDVRLSNFLRRRTPDEGTFSRQMARLFGSMLSDFEIRVLNTSNGHTFTIKDLVIDVDDDTKVDLAKKPVVLADGSVLPVSGWLALAMRPYSNPEMAGVRIYVRGRLAAVTRDFNLSAGFTGEFLIRSYLVGVINADWLDANNGESLIRSDREDILWDSEIGLAFQSWGRSLLREIVGKRLRSRQRARSSFKLPPRKRVTDLEKPLSELRRLIKQHHIAETEYQELMQKYPWILGNEYKVIERHTKLDNVNIPDFTGLRARDDCRDVIEIKSPFINVSRKNGELSAEFNEAWNQAERYLNFVRDEREYLSKKGLKFDRSRCILIAGYHISAEAMRKIRGKERLNPAIVFYSYEELEAIIVHTIDRLRKLRDL